MHAACITMQYKYTQNCILNIELTKNEQKPKKVTTNTILYTASPRPVHLGLYYKHPCEFVKFKYNYILHKKHPK